MRKFAYITKESGGSSRFFQMPQVLTTDPELRKISANAKLLYALLLDRVSLSRKNGWIEEDTGRVYICYGMTSLAEGMGCCERTVSRLMKELESGGLIERKRCGQGKPDRIYVMDVSAGMPSERTNMSGLDKTEMSVPDRTKVSVPDATKCPPIHTEKNQTKKNHTEYGRKKRKESFGFLPLREPLPGMSDMERLRRLCSHLTSQDPGAGGNLSPCVRRADRVK